MSDVARWLEAHGLGKYADAFAENEIDLSDLGELSDEDLRELGLPMGPRRRFLKAVRNAREEGFGPEATTALSPAANPGPGDRAERRQLTVMFADLVGSTELARRLDPEDLRAVNRRYQDAAKAAIETYGGYVARYMGDGVLAYFGFPAGHEDDPERAVRAGLALVEALSRDDESTLAVRVGVATGPVVVGDLIGEGAAQESAVVGETPNLAARLQGLAAPSMVVVAELTRRLVGGAFEFEALAPQELKGFTEPVSAYRVTREALGRTRFETRADTGLSPFVGREEEKGLLLRRWERAERGEGGAVLVVGEAGLGKSRLAEELRIEAAGGDGQLLLLQCSSYYRNTAFHPLLSHLEATLSARAGNRPLGVELVRELLPASEPDPEVSASLLASALGLPDPDEPPVLAALDADARRRRTMTALMGYVEHHADAGPLLCVFEDLHWADPSSAELLSHLVEGLAGKPILLLATTRPGLEVRWSDLSHCRVVTLPRLEDAHAAALASASVALSPNAVREVIDRAGGNPLFIEELARTWVSLGGGQTPGTAPGVPATLHDSLMARLDATGPGRAVAQCAAVLGRELGHAMLSAVWDGEAAALERGLATVLGAGLLRERTDPQGGRELQFRHALIRDAAYASLLHERRRALHQRAAEHLIALREDNPRAAALELIAHHLSEAGSTEAALSYWLRAGEAAARTSSYRECEAHLRRGLAVIGSGPHPEALAAVELDLLVLLGPALMALHGYSAPSVGEIYERARALSEALPGRPHLTPILNGLRLHYICRQGPAGGLESSEALLAHAEALDDDASLIEGRKALGSMLVWTSRFPEARDGLLGAIALYEAGEDMDVMRLDSDSGLTCHSLMGLVEWASGAPERALRHSERALAIAERAGRAYGLGEALSFRALLLHLLRDHASAEAAALAAHRLAQEHGYVLWQQMSSLVHGATLVATGDLHPGIERLERSRRLMLDMGYVLWQPMYLLELGHGYGRLGDHERALAHLEEARALVARNGERFWHPEVHRHTARVLLAAGRPKAAEAAFREALAVARELGHRAGALRTATDLACHWQATGRVDEGKALLAPILGTFEEGFETADLGYARVLLDSLG